MESRKIEKTSGLVLAIVVLCLSVVGVKDWCSVGLHPGCGLTGRVLFSFFHVNIIHALLNVWCLLTLVFLYNISIWRMSLAYAIAVCVPVDTIYMLVDIDQPTVGLSALVFVLFGTISFEVQRKRYYQLWMLAYLAIGFVSPCVNAWLHLYCYIAGLVVALFNMPIKR